MTDGPRPEGELDAQLFRLLADRGPGKSICPSEVARAVAGPDPDRWGPLMGAVRRLAVSHALAGRVVILRKGKLVDPQAFRGVYRIASPRPD